MRLRSPSPIRSPTYFNRVHFESGYHGLIWSVLFLINLVATFIVGHYIIDKTIGFKPALNLISSNDESFDFDPSFYQSIYQLKKSIKIAILATFISNIVHIIYMFILPKFYIQFHLVLSLIYSLIPAILLFIPQTLFATSDYGAWGIIIALISAGIGIALFFYYQKFVATSAELMKASVKILAKHPSLVLVDIFQSLALLTISIFYLLIITLMRCYSSKVEFNVCVYAYLVFSYYWILMTTYYACYMITSGVVGFECYLGKPGSIPQNLVFFSFKRSITKNFGCACFAGLILALIQTLNYLCEYLNPNNRKNKKKSNDDDKEKENRIPELVKTILYYILKCILSILESYFSYISRQALIYCSVYGCSYKESCRRYHKNGFREKMYKIQHESIISSASSTNYILFMIITGIIVYRLQVTSYSDEQVAITSVILTVFFMIIFTFSNSLVTTASDTIFLCYLENPSGINRNLHTLYKKILQI